MKHVGSLTLVVALIACLVGTGCETRQTKTGAADAAEPAVASPTVDAISNDPRRAQETTSSPSPDNDGEDIAATTSATDTVGANPDDIENGAENTGRSALTNGGVSLKIRPRSSVRAGGKRDLTFDDLEFEIARDQDFDRSMLGEEIEALDGQSVIIRGFILDACVFQLKGIKQFVLVRDNQECCFGPGAYIYHNMQVDMAEGKTTDFSVRPVTVTGEFHIKPWIGPDGKCYSAFHMTAQSVK